MSVKHAQFIMLNLGTCPLKVSRLAHHAYVTCPLVLATLVLLYTPHHYHHTHTNLVTQHLLVDVKVAVGVKIGRINTTPS